MNSTVAIVFGLLLTIGSAQGAPVPSPRVQLKESIEQLQKTPDDAALREKIIALAHKVKPAPAVPEEGRKHFVQAVALQKDAKSPSDYDEAIAQYNQALLIAPWWGNAYYNLSVAEEAAGRLDAAMGALKLFVATKPKEDDARQAQDRLYVLEAKQAKAAKAQSAQQEAARTEEEKYGRWLGKWRMIGTDNHSSGRVEEVVEANKSGNQILFTSISGTSYSGNNEYHWDSRRDILRATMSPAGELSWEQKDASTPGCSSIDWSSITVNASPDGRSITYVYPGVFAFKCTPSGMIHHQELTR